MTKFYSSEGILHYSIKEGYRLVVEIDGELAAYYRALIPFWMSANKPRFAPHITVVRIHKEIPKILDVWNKYEGEKISFIYESFIYHDRNYYWLNIWCKRLEEIRQELGMPVTSPYTIPPDGFRKCFHCTIANKKKLK